MPTCPGGGGPVRVLNPPGQVSLLRFAAVLAIIVGNFERVIPSPDQIESLEKIVANDGYL